MVCHATVSGAVCDGPRRVAQTMACQLRGSRRLPKLRLSPQSPHSGFRPPIPVPPRSCPLPAPVSSGPRLPPSPAAGSHACRQCPPSGPTRPLVLVPWVTVPTRPLVLVHWCFGNKLPPSGPTRPLVTGPSGPTRPRPLGNGSATRPTHTCHLARPLGSGTSGTYTGPAAVRRRPPTAVGPLEPTHALANPLARPRS